MQQSKIVRLGYHVIPFGASAAYVGWFMASIPGAIIGGLVAVIYRWWSFQMREERGQNES
jgi:hypothetical protein